MWGPDFQKKKKKTSKNEIHLVSWCRNFCGKSQFTQSFGQIARHSAETVPFHKISTPINTLEILIFCAVLSTFRIGISQNYESYFYKYLARIFWKSSERPFGRKGFPFGSFRILLRWKITTISKYCFYFQKVVISLNRI